jgi:hypothetical protein
VEDGHWPQPRHRACQIQTWRAMSGDAGQVPLRQVTCLLLDLDVRMDNEEQARERERERRRRRRRVVDEDVGGKAKGQETKRGSGWWNQRNGYGKGKERWAAEEQQPGKAKVKVVVERGAVRCTCVIIRVWSDEIERLPRRERRVLGAGIWDGELEGTLTYKADGAGEATLC